MPLPHPRPPACAPPKQAEDAVKRAAKQPALVGQLLGRLAAAPDPQVRQLAALLLRKRITSAWQHLEASVRGFRGLGFRFGLGF